MEVKQEKEEERKKKERRWTAQPNLQKGERECKRIRGIYEQA